MPIPALAVEPIASLTQCPQAVTALAWSPSLAATGIPLTTTTRTASANRTANSTSTSSRVEANDSGVPGPVGSCVSRAESSILAVGMEGGEIELWTVKVTYPALDIVTGTGAGTVTGPWTRDGPGRGAGGTLTAKGWRHLEVAYKTRGGGRTTFGDPEKGEVQVQRAAKLDRTFCHVATVHRLRWNFIPRHDCSKQYIQYCMGQVQDEECVELQHVGGKPGHELASRQGSRSRRSRQLALASCAADHALRIFYVYL